MEVVVRFYGTFRTITGVKDFSLITDEPMTIADLIYMLKEKFFEINGKMFSEFPEGLLSSSLILINGVEINNIEGPNSKLNGDSEVIFLPINHGG
jgi:molybdopterin converting factor small subunit